MIPSPPEPSKQATSTETRPSNALKFSKTRLALAFAIAGIRFTMRTKLMSSSVSWPIFLNPILMSLWS